MGVRRLVTGKQHWRRGGGGAARTAHVAGTAWGSARASVPIMASCVVT